MSSLLARLKANKGQNTKALKERLQQQGQGGFKKDERIWKHTWDEPKTGEFVSINKIRFLPVPMIDMERRENGEIPSDAVLTPCACIIAHFFEGPTGARYIEKSLATFDEECPVRKHDQPLWKQQKETGDEGLKKILMNRLPNTDYYANILVINDAQNPDNNGKVFLFKFGRGIKKIIDAAGAPKFPTDPKIEDVFCPWEGADLDFNLTGEKRKFNGRDCISPDYARVTWAAPAALEGGDEAKIEEHWKKCYSLQDFYKRTDFKPYEQLEQRFKIVMGIPEDAPLESQMAVNIDNSVKSTPTDKQQAGKTTIEDDNEAITNTGIDDKSDEEVTQQTDEVGGEEELSEFERMLKDAQS